VGVSQRPPRLTAVIDYLHLMARAEAADTLMRGLTTVRDLGGPAFALCGGHGGAAE